eukprot:TRINITY_DN1048_c0_g2_i3.p1 TRINITY_DN1048_c0_g2~~TRINITY_DN1048_c0_g2_i3.p1  ORF type:complete len:102 (+),score=36.79 TRINITY_DN1048_c0_g2_i3:84-389(+)
MEGKTAKDEEVKESKCLDSAGTRRADGSIRKPIKVKPGYVPLEERPKYKPPHIRRRELQAKADIETAKKNEKDNEEGTERSEEKSESKMKELTDKLDSLSI